MNNEDIKKHLEKHKEYLAMDKYEPQYPAEFMRLFYSNTFTKIGYWLIALAEGKLVPLTQKQKEFVKNVQVKEKLKRSIGADGKLHSEKYENLYLKDYLLKQNWSEIFNKVKSFKKEQKEVLAKVLDCEPNEDSIVRKIFRLFYKPIFLWDDDESMHYETSYRDILSKVAEKLEIKVDKKDTEVKLQEKITQKTFSDIISNLSDEQKKELEKKLLKEAESLGIDVGSSSIFTLLTAGSLAGFAPYLLVTTTVGFLTSIIGVTLPFGIYTALTSGLSYILGPVGWIGASIFAISRYRKMNMKKLVPAIVLIHSFTTENSINKKSKKS